MSILKQLKYEYNVFSFNDYINLINKFIFEDKYDTDLINDIITYLIIDFKPKNQYDIPYIKWSIDNIYKRVVPEVKSLYFLYNDLRKWNDERITLAKTIDKSKLVFVVDDSKWIWFNLVNDKYNKILSIENLTYNDIMLKLFIDTFIEKISNDFYTTFILYKNITDNEINKCIFIIDTVKKIFFNNRDKFVLNNLTDYLIEEQINNQYMFTKNKNDIFLNKEYRQKLIDVLSKDKNLKNNEVLNKLNKKEQISIFTFIEYIINLEYGEYNYKNYIDYLYKNNYIVEFKLFY